MSNISLTIQNQTVSEVDGMFSLNDLFKSSNSAEPKHQPKRWLQLVRTKALIKELKSSDFMDGNSVHKSNGKAGTFVCRELVYSYAMHISPKFEITVIRAFDKAAQKKLKQAQLQGTAEWQQNRELGKLTRHDATDTIQQFVDYATAQGSRSASRYFMVISKAVNKALSIESRDDIDEETLHLLSTAELIVERTLLRCMAECLPYKTIFQLVKAQMTDFMEMTMEDAV